MIRFISLLVSLAVFSSCKKSDITPPTVSNITVNNTTNETIDLAPGDTFLVKALLTDNLELGQFKIDIHDDFDGHSHKSMMTKYAEIRIKSIDGISYNLEEMFVIPDTTASGIYHGTIQALDAEGNVSLPQVFYFNVVRDEQPTIAMNLPATISAGSVLNIDGLLSAVASDAHLTRVDIRIRSTQTGNDLLKQTYNLSGAPTTWNPFSDGGVSITIPANEGQKLIFRIRVEDSNGNNTIFESEIIIV